MFNMLRNTLLGTVAAIAMVGAAQAATVNITGTPDSTGANNNFLDELNAALGGVASLLSSVSMLTNGPVTLTFTVVAAESGFVNSFTATGAGTLGDPGNFGEGANLLTTAGIGTISGVFNGLLDGLLSFANDQGPQLIAFPGSGEFGVFTDGGAGDHSLFFLAFDDNGAGPDDNHDDLLIRVRVSAVPLPAGGLLLIGGLGALAMVRRRKMAA